jgi:hypothetical protein
MNHSVVMANFSTIQSRSAAVCMGLLVVVGAATPSRIAAAAPTAANPKSADAQKDYAKRFKEALDLLKKRKFDLARTRFLELLATETKPGVLYNVAAAEVELGLYVEALTHYREFLLHPGSKPEMRNEVQNTFIPDLYKKTAHVVVTADPGEEVFLGDKPLGRAPIAREIDIAPGPSRIRSAGREVGFDARAGAVNRIDLRKGQTVTSTQEGIADQQLGRDITAKKPAKKEKGGLGGTSIAGLVIGGLGLGAMGGGVAAVFSSNANAKNAEIERNRIQDGRDSTSACAGNQSIRCNTLRDQVSAQTTMANLGMGLLIGGGAALVLGGTLVIAGLGGESPSENKDKVQPVPAAGVRIYPWFIGRAAGINGTF